MLYFKKASYFFLLIGLVCFQSNRLDAQLFGTKVKRYKSIEIVPLDNNTKFVGISTHRTLIPKVVNITQPATLWNLSGEGQAELIKLYGGKFSDVKAIKKELENKFFKKNPKLKTDYTTLDIQLVFSIEKIKRLMWMNGENSDYSMADRIAYLNYSLCVDTNEIRFVQWNKFETKYRVFNIADITSTNSFSITGGLAASASTSKTEGHYADASSVSPSVSGTLSNSVAENQKVINRNIELNGRISDEEIRIEQEGSREIDLAGNVAIEAKLKFENFSYEDVAVFYNLFTGGIPNSAENITFNFIEVKVPNSSQKHKEIKAILNAEYWYRHVTNAKGRNTFFEWDDRVKMFVGTILNQEETLFKVADYLPNFINLRMKSAKDLEEDYLRLSNISNELEKTSPNPIIFSDYNSAETFRSWLNQLVYFKVKERTELKSKLVKAEGNKNKKSIDATRKASEDFEEEIKKPLVFGKYYKLVWNNKPLTLFELIENPKERIRFNLFFDLETEDNRKN